LRDGLLGPVFALGIMIVCFAVIVRRSDADVASTQEIAPSLP
jgi:hypothetical protein